MLQKLILTLFCTEQFLDIINKVLHGSSDDVNNIAIASRIICPEIIKMIQ